MLIDNSEKYLNGRDSQCHTRIILEPLNSVYDSIVLSPTGRCDVYAIAEFVKAIWGVTSEVKI